ncbi:MFS transporter [Candidatus Poriferisodalis sp.]|uniref:MFS transporter n=1 Tax=Candidatus Poriferisodalis sp. TaxID=3101277 RepID=UPI003B010F3F
MQPFTWLARAHLLSAAGDALIAIALAGSLFFNLDPAAARPKVALYLLVTMAPFAVVGPLIGPLVDRRRGGRRGMIISAGIARAVLALLMVRHLDSLLLFPEAFGALVAGKAYHVAKSAVVPGLVREERDLVEANSKLMLLSGLGGALAAGPGVLLSLISSRWVLVLAAAVFVLMTFPAARLPRTAIRPRRSAGHGRSPRSERSEVAPRPPSAPPVASTRRGGMLLAGSAMGVVRAMTGFTLFLIAFWLRNDDAAPWWFGFMFTASAVGQLLGAVSAPLLRSRIREEVLLAGTLMLAAAVSFYVATAPDRLSVLVLALVMGLMSALGKLCFDAIVQRDEVPADRGRTFARFETRFQLMWVVGALVPVTVPSGILPLRAGAVLLSIAGIVAVVLYAGGLWALARGRRPPSEVIVTRVRTRIRRG